MAYTPTVWETGDVITAAKLNNMEDGIEDAVSSSDVGSVLLACFQHVAWTDQNGQQYYDALRAVLTGEAIVLSIDADYTQTVTVYASDSLDDLKSDLVVTANWSDGTTTTLDDADYTLSGTLAVGSSTITVSYEGKTDTFVVTVSAPNLVAPWCDETTPYALGNYATDDTSGLYPNSGTGANARSTICYDSGTYKYKAKTSNSNDSFKNKDEVDYYPIPIQSGASTATVVFPSAKSIIPNILHYDTTLSCYVRDAEMTPWSSDLTTHTIDVSSYNDGTKYLALNIKAQISDTTGCSVSFS